MQIATVSGAIQVPDLKARAGAAHERVRMVGAAVVRPAKELGARLSAVTRKPWFFPAQVVAVLGLLWLQQHGYLHVPVTMCDWARVGK
ncbi:MULTISPECIES: hypothetical protein [Pseudomonadota]|uniref:Uncharacterized protein n=1 Tax=Chitiniphilus shinanonensis TaxID=553088 RepID=A0ABQ6BS73_9NEIS|nr:MULTISPECIES: hypothetical protein [Pseudomonadota]MCT5279701.1 hypothetical protein [Pseudomonas aeruginosa]QBC33221.1 hypothetical protein DRB87_20455 [Pandoraea sp. XY-2]QFZ02207.1 hypothetical protein CPZ93_27955 [Pseudomonas aeruginosa]WBM13059.1 hypothetical protein M2J77_26910 [Pseudomonas aeruginosa]GLS04840.1 hypothetical protein GCM10007860_19880 [Chitiniphilus shinanonensis]